MPPLRYTLPAGQAAMPVYAAVAFAVVGGVLTLFGGIVLAILLWSLTIALLVVYLLVMFGSHAEFDDTGIRSRRGVFRHHVTWDNVREVALDPKSGQCLICYRHHGKHFKIGAPISGGLSADKEYREKVRAILAYVAAHTAERSPHVADHPNGHAW